MSDQLEYPRCCLNEPRYRITWPPVQYKPEETAFVCESCHENIPCFSGRFASKIIDLKEEKNP